MLFPVSLNMYKASTVYNTGRTSASHGGDTLFEQCSF